MESHEGRQMGGGRRGGARLGAAATALASVLALAVPGVAGATLFSSRAAPAPSSTTITQNTAMIVDVSSTSSLAAEAVSWSDVSWSDAFLTG
jgi:hypothetical protein